MLTLMKFLAALSSTFVGLILFILFLALPVLVFQDWKSRKESSSFFMEARGLFSMIGIPALFGWLAFSVLFLSLPVLVSILRQWL